MALPQTSGFIPQVTGEKLREVDYIVFVFKELSSSLASLIYSDIEDKIPVIFVLFLKPINN